MADLSARRLPAEWEPQRAVLLTWPRDDGDFARWHAQVERCYEDIVSALCPRVPVWIITAGDAQALRQRLADVGCAPERLRVARLAHDDVWIRDYGPLTADDGGQPVHVDFRFNGWGGKFPADRDDAVCPALHALGWLDGRLEPVDWILEGGAIDADGAGTLLTTEHCVLSPSRNGGSRADFERIARRHLGARRVLWLTQGQLEGDDTDGHVDTLARFADPRTIVYQGCQRRDDAHHESLSAMARELAALRTDDGQPYRLLELPLPEPIRDADGRRLPASYANFLITNGAVLAPTYRDPNDAAALAVLREAFPDRDVVGIDCRALIHQYGSLHCVTMQVPAIGEHR